MGYLTVGGQFVSERTSEKRIRRLRPYQWFLSYTSEEPIENDDSLLGIRLVYQSARISCQDYSFWFKRATSADNPRRNKLKNLVAQKGYDFIRYRENYREFVCGQVSKKIRLPLPG